VKLREESKIHYPFLGFQRLKESKELTSGIAESGNPKYLSGEGSWSHQLAKWVRVHV
jgi:hypothetical protein